MAVHGLAPWKQPLGNAPADDYHAFRAVTVGVPEVPAFHDRHAQSFKEAGRDRTEACTRVLVFFAPRALHGEGKADAQGPAVAPRHAEA